MRPFHALIAVLLLSLLASAAPLPADTEPPVVARIAFENREQLAELAARLDIWESHPDQGWLLAAVPRTRLDELQAAGWDVQVDESRSAELIAPLPLAAGQLTGIPGYSCYRTVEETYDRYHELAAAYPGFVEVLDIGDSYDKDIPGGPSGHDLLVLKVTSPRDTGPKPLLFILAAIHARELTTAETALRFVEDLLANYGTDPEATWMLDYGEIQLLFGNPDGRKKAEQGLWWRKNTDPYGSCSYYGVDLNRNSSFRWGGPGSSGNPCDETYRGPSPVSEPETAAMQTYLSALYPDLRGPGDDDPADSNTTGVFLTLHSYGELILWSWGDTSEPPPNWVELQTLGRKMAYFNGYQADQSISLYPTSGTNDDWVYGTFGVPSYTIELGTTFFQDCADFESTIWPRNRNVLRYALKSARLPYQLPSGPDAARPALSALSVPAGSTVTLTATSTDTRYGGSGEPSQPIQAARYSLDLPSWATGALTHPMQPADGSFNSSEEAVTAVVSTAGLAPGNHIIFVESQDATGQWGVPNTVMLTVEPGLNVLAPNPYQSGDPGTTLEFVIRVENLGGSAETYSIQTLNMDWPVDPAATLLGPLAPGASGQVILTVSVPPDAALGDFDDWSVSVTGLGQGLHQTVHLRASAPWLQTYLPVLSISD